jgi:hypothetical protein
MNEWHSIDTAPKDGTTILAYAPEDCYELIFWANGQRGYCNVWLDVYISVAEHNFTHWMPLPPHPKKKEWHRCDFMPQMYRIEDEIWENGYISKYLTDCKGTKINRIRFCPFCGEKA